MRNLASALGPRKTVCRFVVDMPHLDLIAVGVVTSSDLGLIKTVGQIAGIGGLSIGSLILIFREIIRRSFFPTLTKQHGYRLLTLIVVLTWSISITGIVAWAYVERLKTVFPVSGERSNKKIIGGVAKDSGGLPLAGVAIIAVGAFIHDLSSTSGEFNLTIPPDLPDVLTVRATKAGFTPWEEKVRPPARDLIVVLNAIPDQGQKRSGVRQGHVAQPDPIIVDQDVRRNPK